MRLIREIKQVKPNHIVTYNANVSYTTYPFFYIGKIKLMESIVTSRGEVPVNLHIQWFNNDKITPYDNIMGYGYHFNPRMQKGEFSIYQMDMTDTRFNLYLDLFVRT